MKALEAVQKTLGALQKNQEKIMADLSALQSAVTDNTTATNNAVTKIQALVAADQTDPAAIAALTSQIAANTATLTQAVTAASAPVATPAPAAPATPAA